jgi:hypothetical protein
MMGEAMTGDNGLNKKMRAARAEADRTNPGGARNGDVITAAAAYIAAIVTAKWPRLSHQLIDRGEAVGSSTILDYGREMTLCFSRLLEVREMPVS